MPIYPNFYQTLSACPIVELRGYAAACGLKGRLYAYLDFAGPTGTARDGLAEGMLALAIEKKKLISGQPIIEAASGPFAAALTLAGLTAGHPVVLVMPEDAPALRQETLLRLGAQIGGEPCLDPHFKAADLFILLSTGQIERRYARHFLDREH